jgi:polyhydroxyalkanoate synthesis repressor PhaR
MDRIIKRYGSRKLYDTSESRYVSLDDVAALIRGGDDVHVLDNRSGDDVTTVILTQIISEEGRKGSSLLSTGFLHDLVRVGERTLRKGEEAVGAGIKQARQGVDDLARRAVSTIRPPAPLGEVRDEMDRLRARLEALEVTLGSLPDTDPTPDAPASDG